MFFHAEHLVSLNVDGNQLGAFMASIIFGVEPARGENVLYTKNRI